MGVELPLGTAEDKHDKNMIYGLGNVLSLTIYLLLVSIDNVLQKFGLNGKSHPDIFLEAAARLQIVPLNCVIFEDALSDVQG
ncbi:hypothetical protein FIV31_07470 [Coxiella endosymbiont of Ornithodoros amblus]|uniref:hypothetical protein n=1 Tax=Coxiella endosymbiont of Ornithodoros amblus TaxID=1656166 RepID=UPI00244DBA92|nr:hypothetical protein [Coxiella endosymbiont of Ornithodoros amblus]MBW5803080.1 hypothetical protein [Coxiella endosymbiont of Ornithodoros amblus]